MSENGTMAKLREVMVAYARTHVYAEKAKEEKDAVIAAYKPIFDAATEAASQERDAKACVTEVQIEEAIKAGLFTKSNRLPIPGIGWVQATPQPNDIFVADPIAFLDALAENKMLRDMLVARIEIKVGVAEQLWANQPGFPGLKSVPVGPKKAVSIAQYKEENQNE